jgi:hypothetical protein
MAQTSFPFENIDTTETQFSQWARNIGEGVKGATGTNDLKPYADSTSMNVKVYAGQSMVRGHYYVSTATETLTITTSHPSLNRIDAVVLELDPTANSILLKVIAGTAAASPVAPTLTQTDAAVYQQLLGTVYVGAAVGLIAAGNVTDSRSFLPQPGQVAAHTHVIADVTGLQTALDGKAASSHTHNASAIVTTSVDKSNNYTLVAGDKNTYIRSTNAAITITVPDVLADGESVNFIQAGGGQITFAGSGITLNSADAKNKTAKQFAGATVVKSGGAYYLIGNLG